MLKRMPPCHPTEEACPSNVRILLNFFLVISSRSESALALGVLA